MPKPITPKTQFISLLSLGLIILTLFSLINLAKSPTKLFSFAFSDKDFGSAARLENVIENSENKNPSYIKFDGSLFAPQRGYTIETWFRPTQAEFPSKYLFSYQQNDDPLAIIVNSNKTDEDLYNLNLQAFVGEDFDGVCARQSQTIQLTNLTEKEVVGWRHVAITINERGDWNVFVDGKKSLDSGQIKSVCNTSGNFLVGAGWKDAIYPFPMEVDELRVSNLVRYIEEFTPQAYPFEKDLNTLALFDFNKNIVSSVDKELTGEIVGEVKFVKNFYPNK